MSRKSNSLGSGFLLWSVVVMRTETEARDDTSPHKIAVPAANADEAERIRTVRDSPKAEVIIKWALETLCYGLVISSFFSLIAIMEPSLVSWMGQLCAIGGLAVLYYLYRRDSVVVQGVMVAVITLFFGFAIIFTSFRTLTGMLLGLTFAILIVTMLYCFFAPLAPLVESYRSKRKGV
jgi:hypothetical protein